MIGYDETRKLGAIMAQSLETIHATCPHDCPDTCSMLVTVKDGKAISLKGNPDHPITKGFLCGKVSRYIERTYHPTRLLHPLKRIGTSTDIANAATFLLTEKSSWITGEVIHIDGGKSKLF